MLLKGLSKKQELLFNLVPERWQAQLKAVPEEKNPEYLRAIILTDFFSCMTERALSRLYRSLNGF